MHEKLTAAASERIKGRVLSAPSSSAGMAMTRSHVVVLLVLVTGFALSCETSKPERTRPDAPSNDAVALTDADLDELLEQAQKARDREFAGEPPAIESVDEADQLPARKRLPEPVRRERDLLLEQLFAEEADDAAIEEGTHPFDEIARFDAEQHRVVYLANHPRRDEVEAAIVARLIAALDAEHFDNLPEPESWDHQLALQAARHATIGFGLGAHRLERGGHELGLDRLAERPELGERLPVLGERLTLAAGDADVDLTDRTDAVTLREGWTLGAALYRSSGWSAVELARLEPPERTADVVRPDHWMAGEPVGDWHWPKGDEREADRKGTVGPATTGLWLEEIVNPALARTVYSGYTSDAYRHFEATDDEPERFEWLTLWNSPDSAKQVVQAFEMRLRKRFEGADDPEAHYVVFRKGLNVGVIIGQMSTDEKRDRARELLEEHEAELEPREGLPASFVETRQDELNRQMLEAELEDRVWRDPATNLRLDLNRLGEQWQVQEPDQGPVRWFARHPDGAMLQMTVELQAPLGPEFGATEYREQLVDSFRGTLGDAEVDDVSSTDTTPRSGLVIHTAGVIDNQPRELRMWQFPYRDLVISYSLQSPADSFEQHRETATTVLETADSFEEADESGDSDEDAPAADGGEGGEDEGIIEYEVEDH